MNLTVVSINPPRKRGKILAHVTVEAALDGQCVLTFNDLRVLRNRSGELWVAVPSVVIQDENGDFLGYQPAVEFSTDLKRDIEDKVLWAFEGWRATGVQS